MNPAIATLLIALGLFQTKHFLCDFAFQSLWQVRNKGTYGHIAGISHAGLHAIASVPALLVLTQVPVVIAALCLGEFVIHYHSDWSKARIDTKLGLSDKDWVYWVIFGADQFVHQLTYLGMIYILEI
ncbi:MAG: DUF3307 domain-containing protein [Proteobacteria bacterium]|nr:DUF3307 domain-containing protein [Pseudomonadota bacterium]